MIIINENIYLKETDNIIVSIIVKIDTFIEIQYVDIKFGVNIYTHTYEYLKKCD